MIKISQMAGTQGLKLWTFRGIEVENRQTVALLQNGMSCVIQSQIMVMVAAHPSPLRSSSGTLETDRGPYLR